MKEVVGLDNRLEVHRQAAALITLLQQFAVRREVTATLPRFQRLRQSHGRQDVTIREGSRLPLELGKQGLPEDEAERTTLAEVFRAAGYRTAAFVDNVMAGPEFGLDQGFERYDMDAAKVPVDDPEGGIRRIVPRALEWLDSLGEDLTAKLPDDPEAEIMQRLRGETGGRAGTPASTDGAPPAAANDSGDVPSDDPDYAPDDQNELERQMEAPPPD